MNSVTHSNTKVVLENALENFQKIIEMEGSKEAKTVLTELSKHDKNSREMQSRLLLTVNSSLKHFSYKQMEKLLIANYKIFIAMGFCKLYEPIYVERSTNLTEQLEAKLLQDF